MSEWVNPETSSGTEQGLPPHPAYYRQDGSGNSVGQRYVPPTRRYNTNGEEFTENHALYEEGKTGDVSSRVPLATDSNKNLDSQSSERPSDFFDVNNKFASLSLTDSSSSSSTSQDSSLPTYTYNERQLPNHNNYAYGGAPQPYGQPYFDNEPYQWKAENGQNTAIRSDTYPQTSFDPYIAAASNVLGGGPPADYPLGYTDTFNVNEQYSNYQAQMIPNNSGPYADMSSPVNDDQSSLHTNSTRNDPQAPPSDSQDFRGADPQRPALERSGSVSLGTRKMKAVDLSAPPYTKEFIDQYRYRIKNDPDPEAHFQYARYLIDAAKNIGANAADQRAVRKYRELLVQEALKEVRRLATQGDPYPEAQFFLANCYGTGMLGLQVDHERAYHLYLQAAKQNHAAAAYRVAVCNEIGVGTKREPPRAFAFYRKAASLGDTAAMYKLGMILLSGGLTQQANPREAVAWLRRAAEQADEDNPHALHELGLLHENPESKIVQYDPLYAKNLFTKAAQLGYTQSQFKLGQCYEYATLSCPLDPRRSIGWYTRAAEKGDAEAELALSGWYLTGSEGVLKQSDSEAYLWARRAANKGLDKAEYAVGYFSEVGIGVKQDLELAKRWYMRAAAQGNKRAMNRLTELKRMGNKRALAVRPTRQQAKDECIIC